MTDVRRTEDVPHDRLTRLCAAMTTALEQHVEHRGTEQAIVFLRDGMHGGSHLHGYDADEEAMADVLSSVRAVFRAHGLAFTFETAPLEGTS